MDGIIKKSCGNCSQFYQLKSLTKEKHGNIPLLLSCGHSMCENCIQNIVKFAEPIECKTCKKDTEINTANLTSLMQNKISLYDLFPVNIYLLGELTLQAIEHQSEKEDKQEKDYYVDIKAIVEDTPKTEGICLECHTPTTKMCQQCGIIVCLNCFNKSHKNFIIFKNHVLQTIELTIEQPMCSVHNAKPLDYYCKDCQRPKCMDCLMVGGEKSCKNHDVMSAQEANKDVLSDIIDIKPKVEEKLRRFTKTAVDIGNILTNMENESNSSVMFTLINNIEQHFSRLTSLVQKQKQIVTEKLTKMRRDQLASLMESRCTIVDNIKNAKKVVDSLKSIDDNKAAQMNLMVLLEDARRLVGQPWFLSRDDSADTLLKLSINDKVFESIENFIELEEGGSSAYELLTSEQLVEAGRQPPPAPPHLVYPPQIVKDVRKTKKDVDADAAKKAVLIKKVPKYHSKNGSSSSLNSSTSSSSQNSSRNTYKKFSSQLENQKSQTTSYQSIQPRPLLQGDQDLVFITHIVDPHNLFVQRACHQPVVEELLREFRNASSMPKPSPSHIAEGKTYLVYIKADNLWQRGVVTGVCRQDVNRPTFTMFCIDFGSIETVSIDKMRLIPSARIHNPPALAINCSLDSCLPINGRWTSEDALLIQNIIDNKQAVLHVRASGSVRVSAELTTYEHGVSVAHALAFHGRARLVPHTPYPKVLELKEKPKIYSSNNDYSPNSTQDVFVTHIVSPDMFYVRKVVLQKIYEKLCDELDAEYDINDATGSIYLPETDMVCAAYVERCAEVGGGAGARGLVWARARVDQLLGRGRVRVQLLDSGDLTLLHWSALRRLPQKFCNQNALAAQCHLAGVTPLNKKWSPASVELLRAFTGRPLQLVVEGERARGSVGVTLYDAQLEEEEPVCVNTLMIQRKFAVTFGLFMFNKNPDIQDLVRTNKSPLDDMKPARKYKKKVEILRRNQKMETVKKSTDLEAKDKGPIRLEVKILNHQSPSIIYISMVHQEHIFSELYEKIQTYYTKNKTNARENWAVGDRCCTICKQSQTWRRAAVLELEGENAKVFYSDFATIETVPISSLRDMPVDISDVGDAAVLCHLYGVVPAVGDDWPSLTKEYLKELLDAYQRVFITKLGMFKGKSMPIELWVYHTIQGGALEPNVSEWRCLNKKIIEQGLGIPDKTEVVETGSSECTEEGTLSFLNLTGPLSDWLQTEPMPLKPLKMESKSQSLSPASMPSETDEDKCEDYLQDPNTIFISDWKPAEPLPDKEITAIPTYIDNNGVIYLHDVAQIETLEMIRKALDVRFKNPDPKAKYMKWTVGEPCIALYFLDNKFYRGKVIEVYPEASNCLIHYIDYGNEEICSYVNLRKSIVLYQIPIQAHKCVLDRIDPVDKCWDRTTLDYIHKSIVEKACQIKVNREAINDITPIELRYNKLSINDHLVEFEMAKYTDGTKAKVQKYSPRARNLKHVDIVVESDSGPEYIIENDDENTSKSVEDVDVDVCKNRDWNDIVDEDENLDNIKFISYPNFEATNFRCIVNALHGIDVLELCIIHDDELQKKYNRMFTELQEEIENLAPLDGVYENKACAALFPEDGFWYRAVILQYSEAKAKVKVKYVDYGNISVVALSDIREITTEFVELPPSTITASLYNVQINPKVLLKTLHESYKDTLLDKGPFEAKVIEYKDTLPCVELRNQDGKLAYGHLCDEISSKCN